MRKMIEERAKEIYNIYFENISIKHRPSYESSKDQYTYLRLAKFTLEQELLIVIKENEQYLLGEPHHTDRNTECNLWESHLNAKERIRWAEQQLKELREL